MENVEYLSPMDKEEITEDQQGNEAHGFRMGKTVQLEKIGIKRNQLGIRAKLFGLKRNQSSLR
jgi:hypothetical protein